jgi:hypothetical protein
MPPEKLKTILCIHCGFEIATLQRDETGEITLTTPRPIQPRAAPSHPHLALIECPNCGKEMTTPMSLWLEE